MEGAGGTPQTEERGAAKEGSGRAGSAGEAKYPEKRPELTGMAAVLCLLVILIHVCSLPISGLDRTGAFWTAVFIPWRLAAFVVQGFLFLSGLKLCLHPPRDWWAFYRGRLQKIVLPYLIWVAVYYAYFVFFRGYFAFSWADLARYWLIGNIASPFYFVVIVVQFYALLPLWLWLVRHVPGWVAVPLAFALMLWLPPFPYRDRVFVTYLGYWLLGCYGAKHYHRLVAALWRGRGVWAGAFGLVAAGDLWLAWQSMARGRGFSLRLLEGAHMGYCVGAILLVWAVAWRLRQARPLPRVLERIGAVSFPIYLCHCLILQEADRWLMEVWGVSRMRWLFVGRAVLTYGLTLGLCLLYGRWKRNRTRKMLS